MATNGLEEYEFNLEEYSYGYGSIGLWIDTTDENVLLSIRNIVEREKPLGTYLICEMAEQVEIPFYNTDKTDGWMSFVPLQIPVLSTQGGYLYYLEYTNLLTNTNINIYRKAIDAANIANINSSEWTKFQSCKCNNSAGRVYINNHNAEIGEFAATYYLLGTSDEIYVPSTGTTELFTIQSPALTPVYVLNTPYVFSVH